MLLYKLVIAVLLCLCTSAYAVTSQTLTVMTSPSIDGNTVGNTTVFTNDSGKTFYVTGIDIDLVTVSGLGTPPVINIGKTASAYTDIVNAFALTNLTLTGTVIKPTLISGYSKLANGEALVARVATAAIATTTYTFTVTVTGYVR
jgi:hypothetical protein